MAKIGIFAGTFDPVHPGHIAFAQKALEVGKLDTVYFLPEHQPRNKQNVTDFTERLKSLKLILVNYPKLELLELPETRFSIDDTIPKLKELFLDAELSFIMGSDAGYNLPKWPRIESVLPDVKLIIGLRAGDSEADFKAFLSKEVPLANAVVIPSPQPHISSSQLRPPKA